MPLPAAPGLGFKAEHFADIARTGPALGFWEVHAENYMGEGGARTRSLPRCGRTTRSRSTAWACQSAAPGGSTRTTWGACDRYSPASFSEHLAWSSHDGAYLNDLLPLPYTETTLEVVCDHVDEVQAALGRRMLLESPSTYVLFAQSTISETEFFSEVARRTGCGLLLDVNNVFVSATNHRTDPLDYLAAFPLGSVGEIHLGGFFEEALPSGPLLIDAHGASVSDPVWDLFGAVLERTGPLPTLIEWDNDVPPLAMLLRKAERAGAALDRARGGGLALAS